MEGLPIFILVVSFRKKIIIYIYIGGFKSATMLSDVPLIKNKIE